MLFIICYDISDDRRRKKVSDILEGYGTRVQESVFESNINIKLLEELILKLSENISATDSVRIYPLCSSCYGKAIGIGFKKEFPGSRGFEVF